MPDFTTKLEMISRRGNPVGAEELIERIEAQLAGDPLVVVSSRRKGAVMTKTDQPTSTKPPGPGRGLVWALAAFVAIMAVAGIYLATAGGNGQVAEPTPTTVAQPTPTTPAPMETMTDLETIEAGVAAFYSGDAERAAELFELPDRTDDQIRSESAYQAAIDGRLSLNCIETTTGFSCRTPYHNAMTDAIGHIDSGDTHEVVVEDGVITAFGFPEHSFAVIEMGTFLAMEGRLEGYEGCDFGPFPKSCATIQLENIDAWAEWREIVTPADFVEHALESWYGGDCPAAVYASGGDCSTSSPAGQMIAYESILEADVSVENCQAASVGEETRLSCEVHYSNVMNAAVGKASSVTSRGFVAFPMGWVAETTALPTEPWYDGVYPEDAELRASFQQFAEGGDLAEAYADAGCASTRSPACANLIMANLDDWATWYEGIN